MVVLVVFNYLDMFVIGGKIDGIVVVNWIVKIFFVGMKVDGDILVVLGGCVLVVIGIGFLFVEVCVNVYVGMVLINYFDGYFWCDIGWCEVECE